MRGSAMSEYYQSLKTLKQEIKDLEEENERLKQTITKLSNIIIQLKYDKGLDKIN